MRIAVTGSTGNVGTAVVRRLAAEPAVTEIVGLARRPAPSSVPKLRQLTGDLAVDDLRPLFDGADVLLHLAWLFQPTHDPVTTWRVNVGGGLRLFAAAEQARIPAVVYASSVGAYSPGPADGHPVDEGWPTHGLPTAGYGREKAYLERALDAVEARLPGSRIVRVRPGFVFQRSAASQQRRLFAGPFVPGRLLRPGRLPVLPYPSGLRFQAVHADDLADAVARAVLGDVRGAFNVAADPVIGRDELADLLGARPVSLPPAVVRAALSAGWRLHLVPAEPALFDLALGLPVMDTSRVRTELGWQPRYSATAAVAEMIRGLVAGAGGETAPLRPDSPLARLAELRSRVGGRP
jgi:nucleoside-diphosphate-sugar epimerase